MYYYITLIEKNELMPIARMTREISSFRRQEPFKFLIFGLILSPKRIFSLLAKGQARTYNVLQNQIPGVRVFMIIVIARRFKGSGEIPWCCF